MRKMSMAAVALVIGLGVALAGCGQIGMLKAKMAIKSAHALYQQQDYRKAAEKYEEALSEYLLFRQVAGPEGLFAGIKSLPPGCTMTGFRSTSLSRSPSAAITAENCEATLQNSSIANACL